MSHEEVPLGGGQAVTVTPLPALYLLTWGQTALWIPRGIGTIVNVALQLS